MDWRDNSCIFYRRGTRARLNEESLSALRLALEELAAAQPGDHPDFEVRGGPWGGLWAVAH